MAETIKDPWDAAIAAAETAHVRVGCSRNCYDSPDDAESASAFVVKAIKDAAAKHRAATASSPAAQPERRREIFDAGFAAAASEGEQE